MSSPRCCSHPESLIERALHLVHKLENGHWLFRSPVDHVYPLHGPVLVHAGRWSHDGRRWQSGSQDGGDYSGGGIVSLPRGAAKREALHVGSSRTNKGVYLDVEHARDSANHGPMHMPVGPDDPQQGWLETGR